MNPRQRYDEAISRFNEALERKRKRGEVFAVVVPLHATPSAFYLRAKIRYENGDTQRWCYPFGWNEKLSTNRAYRMRAKNRK